MELGTVNRFGLWEEEEVFARGRESPAYFGREPGERNGKLGCDRGGGIGLRGDDGSVKPVDHIPLGAGSGDGLGR